ncbi:MAG: response regulator [Phycisphaerales bacterium JB039]
MTTHNVIRILCVDDHAFLVEGLRSRLEMERDLHIVGRLATADDLVLEARRLRPDLVLLDIEMPGVDPFEAAEDLHNRCPEVKTIILSAFVRDHYLSAAFGAGCWGYFSKSDEVEDIVDGVRRAVAGEFVLSPKVAERCKPLPELADARAAARAQARPPASRLESLTGREQEVLRLIGRGLTRSEMAAALHRSPKTIDGHRERIMRKLDIHSNAELVRFAIREGVAEV